MTGALNRIANLWKMTHTFNKNNKFFNFHIQKYADVWAKMTWVRN